METEINKPKEAFEKGVEEARIRNKAKEFLNSEFNTLSEKAFWEFMGVESLEIS